MTVKTKQASMTVEHAQYILNQYTKSSLLY